MIHVLYLMNYVSFFFGALQQTLLPKNVLNQVKQILAKSGRNIRMGENCGMPDEHIYNSVEEIPDDAGYYSLIIAKEQDGGL